MLENMHRIQAKMNQLRNECQNMHHNKKSHNKSFSKELDKAKTLQSSAENSFATSLATNNGKQDNLSTLIDKHAKKNGIDPDLVKQLIGVASGNNSQFTGKNGQLGLMQLKPDVFNSYGFTDPFNPDQNLSAGTQHLAEMLKRNGGNVPLALASYNTDPATVGKFGGIPPFQDTQAFVKNVISKMQKKK